MNKEIKTKWVAALRSGKYKQTQGALRRPKPSSSCDRPEGYCCLGVLCKVVAPNKRWSKGLTAYSFYKASAVLPKFILDSLNLTSKEEDCYYKLPSMNDSGGRSFAEIADFVEANL